MGKAFESIAAGLKDAIAFANGDLSKGRAAIGLDVKAIRAKTGLSQTAFAAKFRIPAATVRDWEQWRRVPDAPARALLAMIDADPEGALGLIEKAAA